MEGKAKRVKIIRATKGEQEYGKIRMAAYCRVSTDSSDQANSFMAQMQYYNDYIRQNPNMVLVDIYADEGITGTSIEKRTEFHPPYRLFSTAVIASKPFPERYQSNISRTTSASSGTTISSPDSYR